MRDLYGYLIDGMEGVAGALHVGGDGGGNLEGNLPTQAPLALFSGVVKVGADGKAEIPFDLPSFNGAVRVTAVAWTTAKVGAASADMIVRDPVVVTASLPRFLDIGDRSRLQFDIDNVEGEAGEYKLSLDIHGPVAARGRRAEKTIKLAAHEKATVTIPIEAQRRRRPPSCRLDVSGPGFSAPQNFALERRTRERPTSTRAASADLAPGGRRQDRRCAAARLRARHRLAVAFGVAVRRHRRARGVAGARTLSLWLLRTDREPRDAAALRQPTGQRRASGDRPRSRRPHQARRSTRR